MENVKFRTREPRLAPRRTKLEIPGWAGEREPRADGSQEYAWHCTPFSESAQYGVELFYPYDNELIVSTRNGKLLFEGDFGPCPEEGLQWPPFRNFGDAWYTYQILLDLKVESGFAIRTEPHPRFYTDRTDTCPIAVPALIRNWWPMMFFMRVQGARRRTAPCFPAGRSFRPDHRHSGGGPLRPRGDGCRRVGRARIAGPSHPRQPRPPVGGHHAGFRARRPCSMAPIVSCCARPRRSRQRKKTR